MSASDLLARCTFPPARTEVTCAVSGGPDSTALLALAVEAGLQVTACHVDHGLRADSSNDAAIVRATAARLGTRFDCVRADVAPGPNLEERARIARHSALPHGSLLGHTADDQAETVLLHLLRGSGLHGLGGMRADDGRRPLLLLRRAETRSLCDELGLPVIDDPMNTDVSLRRTRVRHELLPLLDSIAERDVVPLLCRFADVARESTDHLDREAASIDVCDAAVLRDAPPVLARLAVRAWLREHDDRGHPPDAATIERVLAVARLELGASDIGSGWQVRRSGGRLYLLRRR
ncbi:MAG: tRNA lysidine(34) synthetase TilS [Actinobacteria bacterium]|nr:tRNA lysidine(34) synthetase TilS [Actinomycetota bacterium]